MDALSRIGRYEIREVIGTGGFATVYRATDDRFDVDVAIKVLAENHSLDPDIRERFIDEGRRLRRTDSPYVIRVYDLGETDRHQPYLVLERADRGDLAMRVARLRQGGWQPALAHIQSVADVLAHGVGALHRQHLVHRDLSPGNLLILSQAGLGADQRVSSLNESEAALVGATEPPAGGLLLQPGERLVLADLGVSKDLAVASGLTLAAGTSGFAPPEQREPGNQVDQRADIWAASALLVWLALGHPPDADGRWQVELAAIHWPSSLIDVLTKGLAPEPADRYPTIVRWHEAVTTAVGPTDVAEPASIPAEPGPGAQRARRAGWPTRSHVFVVAGTLIAGAAGGWLVAGGRAEPGPTVRTATVGDDGQVRTTVEDHGITITLDGPTEAEVGGQVTFDVSVEGADEWAWVGPDGHLVPARDQLELAPRTTGTGTVRVLAFNDTGQPLEASRELTITEG